MGLISTDWHRLWLCYKFLCSTFSKGTFDFIKRNTIRELFYKVKNIRQIKGGFEFKIF